MEHVISLRDNIRSKPHLTAAALAAAAWVLWIVLLPAHAWSKHISNLGLTVMPLVAAWQCARPGVGPGPGRHPAAGTKRGGDQAIDPVAAETWTQKSLPQ